MKKKCKSDFFSLIESQMTKNKTIKGDKIKIQDCSFATATSDAT